jgi:APA family basic amino acid/polyamine antiporter
MGHDIFRKKTPEVIRKEVEDGILETERQGGMNRVLTVRDLTFMGIAAIVGAGIFSTIGEASLKGGPGVVLLFLFVSLACGLSAVCYAEFASMIPVSGSAYTYSYVAFGEIIAWIIGWDLLFEYAIGNIAVAISWSNYFVTLLEGLGIHTPEYLTMDYWTAQAMHTSQAKLAWLNAPMVGGLKIICNLPAFLITVVITWIIYVGIQESRKATNAMVVLKLVIIAIVIVAGAFYVQPTNWHPFLPNGIKGVLSGTAAVFFAYIGFDAISTTAEECRNPQRDLPRGMFYSLIACTIIYVLVALILTGMVSYKQLGVGDPLAYVFQVVHLKWVAGIVAVSAVIATASVLLVFQLGQPRIWMSMSRDGLLPPIFSRMHPKYKTPSFSTVLTGFVVGIPALFLNLNVVVDLCSVGTLFAFVLVCGGILKLQSSKSKMESKFKTPYVNSKWIVPVLFLGAVALFTIYYPGGLYGYFNFADVKGNVTYDAIREKVPFLLFGIVFLVTTILAFIKNFSLIPVLGFLCCTYLLCESGTSNWERFLAWLAIGLCIYFLYGIRHSRLGKNK